MEKNHRFDLYMQVEENQGPKGQDYRINVTLEIPTDLMGDDPGGIVKYRVFTRFVKKKDITGWKRLQETISLIGIVPEEWEGK